MVRTKPQDFPLPLYSLTLSFLTSHLHSPLNQLDDWYVHFSYFACYLAYSNSAINPFIYAGFNANFMKELHSHHQGLTHAQSFRFSRGTSLSASPRQAVTVLNGGARSTPSGSSWRKHEVKTTKTESGYTVRFTKR
ncbi:substance-P receptor-like [Elysia marginata]|uniref:Substance-P receptor-like n=1 Tax=Elysia marginata TaxID=1093978 RepID=A0AAV4JHU2_9GAST|nr:substance-P receptor-like [Elysia marginata]